MDICQNCTDRDAGTPDYRSEILWHLRPYLHKWVINKSLLVRYISVMKHKYGSIRGLLEKYPTFGREKETGLLGALDT